MIIYGKNHRFNAQPECTVTDFFLSDTTPTKIRVNVRFSIELFQRTLSDFFYCRPKIGLPMIFLWK